MELLSIAPFHAFPCHKAYILVLGRHRYYDSLKWIRGFSTYENEQSCQEIFPREFTELKFDIKSTIEKFNNTYNLPEIQGSRLKNLMYGVD